MSSLSSRTRSVPCPRPAHTWAADGLVRGAGRDLPRRHRRRGDVRRYGPLRPPTHSPCLVRDRAAMPIPELLRSRCVVAGRSVGRRQSVLPACSRLVSLCARGVRHRGHGDRVASHHFRLVLADPAGDPARVPAAPEHSSHRKPRARADLRADRELDAGRRHAGCRDRLRLVRRTGRGLWHRGIAANGDHHLPCGSRRDPMGLQSTARDRGQWILSGCRSRLLIRRAVSA